MPSTQSAMTVRLRASVVTQASARSMYPLPVDPDACVAELVRRASTLRAAADLILAKLLRASRSRDDLDGAHAWEGTADAARLVGEAANLMDHNWTDAERRGTRAAALRLCDFAMNAPARPSRCFAHFVAAHIHADAGDANQAFHHSQMADIDHDDAAAGAQLAALRKELELKIISAASNPQWMALQFQLMRA